MREQNIAINKPETNKIFDPNIFSENNKDLFVSEDKKTKNLDKGGYVDQMKKYGMKESEIIIAKTDAKKVSEQQTDKVYKKLRPNKLVDAADLYGNKNEVLFEVVKKLEEECSHFPEFIGVVPFGSYVRGYNKEGSDMDMVVFLEYDNYRMYDIFNSFADKYKENGVKLSILPWSISRTPDIYEKEKTVDAGTRIVEQYNAIPTIGMLAWCGIGPKLNKYREDIREKISILPKKRREELLNNTLIFLMGGEKKRIKKIRERIGDFDEKNYLNEREELWKKRIAEIYGATKAESAQGALHGDSLRGTGGRA